MAFDIQKFKKTDYTPRIGEVPVPDLAEFFSPDDPKIMKVRGLTGNELAVVHEAVANQKNILGILESLMSSKHSEKLDALRKSLGISEDVPSEICKRIKMLTTASVDPVFDEELSVKFAENHPIEFYALTNKITELTGLGAVPLGKPQPSGVTQESKQL